MTRFRPLRVSDFYTMNTVDHAWGRLPFLLARPLALYKLAEDPFSFAMEVEGELVALAGVVPETGEVWALLASDMKRHMVRLTRYALRWFEMLPGLVWMHTDNDYPPAARWALLMGFKRTKKGDRYDTYARIV